MYIYIYYIHIYIYLYIYIAALYVVRLVVKNRDDSQNSQLVKAFDIS
jgi:hypothetical protein